MKKHTVSRKLDKESPQFAEELIAQRALTNSKRPESYVKGVYPTHAVRASGCRITDSAGNEYIDFICGLGTMFLGYGNDQIAGAVTRAYMTGATLSLSTVDELDLARLVRQTFSFVERLKVVKTGSEACTASVRIARAFTGRKKILQQGYSGWHDEFISTQPPALGVVNEFHIEKLTDLDQVTSDVAGVILEPVITTFNHEREEWLRKLQDKCKKTGTVLIFDETITGLRFPKLSVASYLGLNPDIIILGKALGGGMPISVVGGRKDVMNCGEYFVSGSFCGERPSLQAAIKTIELLSTKYSVQDLWDSGRYFVTQFNELFRELGVEIEGYPTRGILKGELMEKALFMQEACKAGLLFGPSWFYSFAHMGERDLILNLLKQVKTKLETKSVKLEGELPRSPFAQKQREVKT